MAAMMVVSMASVAAVAVGLGSGTCVISVASTDTHTYDVYQILYGDLDASGTTLSNVSWGTNGQAPSGSSLTATQWAKSLEGMTDQNAIVAAVEAVRTGSPIGRVSATQNLTGLATGYYVMVDVTDPLSGSSGTDKWEDTKALNVILVLNNVTVTKKWGSSEDHKKIATDTLGKTSGTNDINDDDDNVSIGDTVNYEIDAKVPDNTDQFAAGKFFFVVTDKLSAGLTFNNDIEVFLGATKLESTEYTVKTGNDCVYGDNTFEVALTDPQNAKFKGQTITVKYSAIVNDAAEIGDTGNPNTSTVKFSNDPNKKYDGEPDKNHDGFPDNINDVPTGTTPESKTITYVTGIEILKVDEDGKPLTGAKFSITGTSVKVIVTKGETFTKDENGNYYKLKDGTYTMTKPHEDEMVAAAAGATKGYVVDAEASGDGVITIGETKYRPYVPATDAGKAIFVLKNGSTSYYDNPSQKYKKTATKGEVLSGTAISEGKFVDDNGLVRFDGLGQGAYTITETVTPNGYNTIEPITVNVTYKDPDTNSGTFRFDVTGANAVYEDGTIKVKIENKKGGLLPETGGIGTTIFYVAGSILVLAAAILLITKRRMGAND